MLRSVWCLLPIFNACFTVSVRAPRRMNIAEIIIGFFAVAVQNSNAALSVFTGFTVLVMTFWKTVAYLTRCVSARL